MQYSIKPTSKVSDRHYPALDGLRGVAALLIVWHHFLQFTPVHEKWLAHIGRFTAFTWIGVDLFFVLSGFLITGILADSKSKKHYFRTFYGRRILRIFPLYYTVLIVVLAILPRLGVGTGIASSSHIFFWTYTSNFYSAFGGWRANYLSHLWTLAIEEQFYLLWPLVLFLAFRFERLHFGLLIAFLSVTVLRGVLYALGINFTSLYLSTETHCDALILGGYLALSVRSGSPNALKGLYPKKWVTASLALTTYALVNPEAISPALANLPIGFYIGNMLTLPLLAILFVWLVRAVTLDSGRIYRFFSHPALRWFGKYSYALYVLHVPIAYLILRPKSLWYSSHPVLDEFGLFLLYFGVSIAAAFLSWHLFEKHFLKLKRYFKYGPETSVTSPTMLFEEPT